MDIEKLNISASAAPSDEELVIKMRSLKKWSLVEKIVMNFGVVGGFAVMAVFAIQEMWIAMIVSVIVVLALMFVLSTTARKKTEKLKS